MRYDRKKEFVERCRSRMSGRGCRECGRVLPQGLFLEGKPSLSSMVRAGNSVRQLKTEMRRRGWVCRKCANKVREVRPTAAATTRDQFATQEEYYAWLEENRGPGR